MQTSTNVKTPDDTAEPARSLRRAESSSQRMVKGIGHELKPTLLAGLAVVTLATVAGVAIALARRSKRSVWLPPERPSALGTAARGAGIFLLRLAARQVAAQLLARLDASAPTQEPQALPTT